MTSLYFATAFNSDSVGDSAPLGLVGGATALAMTPSSPIFKNEMKLNPPTSRIVRCTFVQSTEFVIELNISNCTDANLRMFQRFAVNFMFGDLGELVDECFYSDSFGNQLTQRLLQISFKFVHIF